MAHGYILQSAHHAACVRPLQGQQATTFREKWLIATNAQMGQMRHRHTWVRSTLYSWFGWDSRSEGEPL